MIAAEPTATDSPPPRSGHPDGLRGRLLRHLAGRPAWVLVTRLFIGLGWLRAAGEKILDPAWWRGQTLATFLADTDEAMLGWYRPFIELVTGFGLPVVAMIVVVAQLGAGIGLITGRHLGRWLAVGIFLNLNFVAAGAVNPSAFYLLSQGALALWLAERHRNRGQARRLLIAAAAVSWFLLTLNLTSISTVHPAEVIDDPAVMLVFGAALAVIGCDLAHRRIAGGAGLAGRLSPDSCHRGTRSATAGGARR